MLDCWSAFHRVSAGTIKNMWRSIEGRPQRFSFALPLGGPGDFKRLYQVVAAVKGTSSKPVVSIGLHHFRFKGSLSSWDSLCVKIEMV